MSKNIRDKVSIVGVGACKFGENWDQSREDMIVDAAYEAYADAGIDEPQKQIEAVFCGSVYPSGGTGEVAEALKLFGKPISKFQAVQHQLAGFVVTTRVLWIARIQPGRVGLLGEDRRWREPLSCSCDSNLFPGLNSRSMTWID